MKLKLTRTAPKPPHRHTQRGQAVIWLLGTLAASAAVLYAVYNVGQLNTAKAKTVNAADAAALAGATVEARMLNLIAYNNRSMMANEVFLVQMLSIESWLGYLSTTADNIGTVLSVISVVVPPLQVVARFLDKAGDLAEKIRDPGMKNVIKGMIPVLEGSKTVFKGAHTIIAVGGSVAAENAATKVVQLNRAEFGIHKDAGVEIDNRPAVRAATFLTNGKRWLDFTKVYEGNQRTDSREVLLKSRDEFSTNRPGQPWFNLNLGISGTEKRGGTQLINFDRWETQDTLELWQRGIRKKYQPIGWGRANADEGGTAGSRWSPNRTAQKNAYNDGRSGHSYSGWSGVPTVYDIQDKSVANRATLGVDFLVAVRRPKVNTMTTTYLKMGTPITSPTGSPDMPEELASDQISSIGKARVFFERPQKNGADFTGKGLFRPDNAKEYGSLFSPYWQARLTDVSRVEKIGLMAAMGINPTLFEFTPGGH
jgi:hypothetical protein